AEDGRPHLDIVLDCTMKARQIIADLLAFSKPTARDVEILDPVTLIDECLRLVRQAVPINIVMTVQTDGCLPSIAVNRTSFVQVILNLVTNAAAAMSGTGTLTISMDEHVVEPEPFSSDPCKPTHFARLRVTDTGCGMSKEILDRVFEPFFTTKPIGDGTGLGLPVVYGLVQEMHGTISLASELGRGTTVTILIPSHGGTQ
ncbi:sensor histidine kinase, partial [Paracraurococcus lichenis]